MDDRKQQHSDKQRTLDKELDQTVVRKTRRMEAHRRHRHRSPWFGLGFMGLIGWSIAVPTLLGVWLGKLLDNLYPGPPSWTLTFLLVGLLLGCINAAFWISTENTRHKNKHEGKPNEH